MRPRVVVNVDVDVAVYRHVLHANPAIAIPIRIGCQVRRAYGLPPVRILHFIFGVWENGRRVAGARVEPALCRAQQNKAGR